MGKVKNPVFRFVEDCTYERVEQIPWSNKPERICEFTRGQCPHDVKTYGKKNRPKCKLMSPKNNEDVYVTYALDKKPDRKESILEEVKKPVEPWDEPETTVSLGRCIVCGTNTEGHVNDKPVCFRCYNGCQEHVTAEQCHATDCPIMHNEPHCWKQGDQK